MFKSGQYLEPNRVAFRVPVHLTKPEIRNYLREIYNIKVIKVNTYVSLPKRRQNAYGDYYKNGPAYKKAFVTCEERIPDDVKMIYNSRRPGMQPAITKYDTPGRKKWRAYRPGENRSADWKMRHPLVWSELIPTLLRGDDFPPPKRPETLLPDHTKPFAHYTHLKEMPPGTPEQEFPRIDLAMLRADKERRRTLDPANSFINIPDMDESE